MRSAVFACLIWLAPAGCAPATKGAPTYASAPSSLLGLGAPELRRPRLGSGSTELLSLAALRGRVVVVDFFAEFCKPCLRTLPDLEQLRQSRSDITIIGVAEDTEPDASLRLVQQLSLGFPVVYDRDHVLSGRYRVDGLPATFVVDRQGIVRWVSAGVCDRAQLEAVLGAVR